jgi:hypothetical protein
MLPWDDGLAAELALAAHAKGAVARAGAYEPTLGPGQRRQAIVLDVFSGIAAAWRPILAKAHHKLTLASVFCHSRPHVCSDKAAGGNGRCELADLLIVVDYHGPGALLTERRAQCSSRPSSSSRTGCASRQGVGALRASLGLAIFRVCRCAS